MRRARATRSGWGIAIAAIIGVRVLGSIISGTDNGSSAVPAQTFVQPPLRLVMLPLTIDDAIPITSQKVRGAISRIEAGGERVKAQFYGVRGDHPSFMLVVVSMPPGGTPDDIFRRVTDKIPGGKRVGKISRTASNGITYLCTQVDGKQPGSVCMWIGPQDSGYLRAYEPGGHPLERIARVRRNTTL